MKNNKKNTVENDLRVINIKSEILFREAEDEFMFFSQSASALKKLKLAVELSPVHTKSLVLTGDIYFIRGRIKKALGYYKRAEAVKPRDVRISALIANCFKVLGDNESALKYCDKALYEYENETDDKSELAYQISEMKAELLISIKDYNGAGFMLSSLKNIVTPEGLGYDSDYNYRLLKNKIQMHQKIEKSKFRVI